MRPTPTLLLDARTRPVWTSTPRRGKVAWSCDVSHWEVARFCRVVGRRLFGLLPRVERWSVTFPPGFELPEWRDKINFHSAGSRYYRMRLRGRLGPRGTYGHRGICSHVLSVTEVVSFEETTDPGPTW
jgi:hypothetical protein